MKTLCVPALVTFMLVSAVMPLAAHHSWPITYDRLVTVKGTVVEFKWANPHSYIDLDVNGDHWRLEIEAVNLLRRYESDRIRLLDYVFGESLEELWSNAYCVVQPSTMEGLSIALLEALSYGRCVLISDIPENMEVAEECALSFRSKDVEDLRSKLAHLIQHPEEVERYGARARAHIAQHYSWDNVAESTAKLYEDVTGKKR